MDTATSGSGNSGCVSAIGFIFPILLTIGILLIVLSIIGTTLSEQESTTVTLYRVQPGDTLQTIADRFGVSPEAIQEANALDSEDLKPGQELVIPRPEVGAEQTRTPTPPQTAQATPTRTRALPEAVPSPTPPPTATEMVAVFTPTPPPTEETPGLPDTGGVLDLPLPETGGVPAIAATPLPKVYAQASWPPGMAFNDSDIIDLLLTTVKAQPISPGVVTATAVPQVKPASIPLKPTPFRRKIITSEALDFAELCNIPSGYQGFAIANLYGSAFDISPQGPQREALTKLTTHQSTIAWAWTITPKRSGSHKVNLSFEIEWVPLDDDTPAPVVQCDVWKDQVLNITVKDPPLFVRGQISLAGIGLIILGGFGTIFRGRIEDWLQSR